MQMVLFFLNIWKKIYTSTINWTIKDYYMSITDSVRMDYIRELSKRST